MADNFEPHGQAAPAADVATDLLDVAASTNYVISGLFVCAYTSAADDFSVSIAYLGAAESDQQWLYRHAPIPGTETLVVVAGITLKPTDILRVECHLGTVSFNLFGDRIA